jgi:hypothetical protein
MGTTIALIVLGLLVLVGAWWYRVEARRWRICEHCLGAGCPRCQWRGEVRR